MINRFPKLIKHELLFESEVIPMSNVIVTKMVNSGFPFFERFKPSLTIVERIKVQDGNRYTRLERQHKKEVVEECFEERSQKWLMLTPTVNPYSSVLYEIPLLEIAYPSLREALSDSIVSFLGVGNGDFELRLLQRFINEPMNYEQIIPIEAVDLSVTFLDYFFLGVSHLDFALRRPGGWTRRELLKEYQKEKGKYYWAVYCRGIHGYFQKYRPLRIHVPGIRYMYILPGNTFSNFNDQTQAAQMLFALMESGDHILMGVREALDTDYLLDLYSNNPTVHEFIGYKMNEVRWERDQEDTLRCKRKKDGKLCFLTRSYTVEDLKKLFPALQLVNVWVTVASDPDESWFFFDRRNPLRLGSILALFRKP